MARTKASQKPSSDQAEQPRRSTRSQPALVVLEPKPEPKPAKSNPRKRKTSVKEAEDKSNLDTNEASPDASSKRAKVEEPRPLDPNRTTILSLPAELIQNICLELPFTRDAISVHLSSGKLSAALDNFFWYQRRLVHDVKHYGARSRTAYKSDTSYLDECLRAYYGWTGGRLGDGIQHNIQKPPKASSKTRKAMEEQPLTTRQTRWKRLSFRSTDIYACQSCCFQPANRYYSGFRLSLCHVCLRTHAVTRKCLTFLSLPLRKSGIRRQPTLKGLEPEYIWIADLDPLAIEKYGKGIRELLREHDESEADKSAKSKAYLERQKERFLDYAMTQWALPEYDEFRTILTPEVMRAYFTYKTNGYGFFSQIARTRMSYTDKPAEWHQERLDNQLEFLSRAAGVGCLRWGFYAEFSYPGSILQAVRTFHMRRFMTTADAGSLADDPDVRGFSGGLYLPSAEAELPSGWTTASDGKCLVGLCAECYHQLSALNAAQRAELDVPAAEDAELEFEATVTTMEDFRESCRRRGMSIAVPKLVWFSALGLIQHYTECHTMKSLSLERNEGGVWWDFLREVEGLEPQRVWSLHEMNENIPLPGGGWTVRTYKTPPAPFEPAMGKGAMRECQRALMEE